MLVLVLWGASAPLRAQGPAAHYRHDSAMPPGAIGSGQLQRGGPLPGYFQPVRISAPEGSSVSLVQEGRFARSQRSPLDAGMLIGSVYRLRVTGIPLREGEEVFPTIELIDRIYPPQGQERRFAIPIPLVAEDLAMALEGKFITRVIYLEDPRTALAIEDSIERNWIDVRPGENPLRRADVLGRPVAILRMGGRLPDARGGPDLEFLRNSPPLVRWPRR